MPCKKHASVSAVSLVLAEQPVAAKPGQAGHRQAWAAILHDTAPLGTRTDVHNRVAILWLAAPSFHDCSIGHRHGQPKRVFDRGNSRTRLCASQLCRRKTRPSSPLLASPAFSLSDDREIWNLARVPQCVKPIRQICDFCRELRCVLVHLRFIIAPHIGLCCRRSEAAALAACDWL